MKKAIHAHKHTQSRKQQRKLSDFIPRRSSKRKKKFEHYGRYCHHHHRHRQHLLCLLNLRQIFFYMTLVFIFIFFPLIPKYIKKENGIPEQGKKM